VCVCVCVCVCVQTHPTDNLNLNTHQSTHDLGPSDNFTPGRHFTFCSYRLLMPFLTFCRVIAEVLISLVFIDSV
jgi:hypothetical protein